VRIEQPILRGRLIQRYERFLADVELADGSTLTAHCPNTGSLLGCLAAGSHVVLRDSQDERRKLRHTLQAIRVDGHWVNVDTSLPNRVVREAIVAGRVPELVGYDDVRAEVAYGRGSRADLLLTRGAERCWVEVKSTTLARDGVALFPDAVTERGRKHLGELARAVRRGERAVQFFLVSRGDVVRFAPAADIDPEYAKALRRAVRAGVEVLAYTARVEPRRLELARALPVDLTCGARRSVESDAGGAGWL
jgi:sugar fermentation stimulation protein A